MVSYDDVWTSMLVNCNVDNLIVPTEPVQIYDYIHNAISLINNRLATTYTYDDELEQVNETLTSSHILILANYIRLVILRNNLSYKSSIITPYSKEISIRNLSAQLKPSERLIEDANSIIDNLIFNSEEE